MSCVGVIGASGNTGFECVKECLRRGYDVRYGDNTGLNLHELRWLDSMCSVGRGVCHFSLHKEKSSKKQTSIKPIPSHLSTSENIMGNIRNERIMLFDRSFL